MKFKKLLITTALISNIQLLDASVSIANLQASTTSLLNAINNLRTAMGLGVSSVGGYSNQGFGIMQTTITNNTSKIIHLNMFDQNNAKINSTITMMPQSSTYAPLNAVGINVADEKDKELVGLTQIRTNTPYTISLLNNRWEVSALETTANYKYTNNTNIPLIVKITANNLVVKEDINPTSSFTHTLNPSTYLARKNFILKGDSGKMKSCQLVSVDVHANLSACTKMIDKAASYSLVIEQNQLVCKSTASTGNTITNNTGWPMFISLDQGEQAMLNDGNRFTHNGLSNNIAIIPVIKNHKVEFVPARNLTFTNNKGEFAF